MFYFEKENLFLKHFFPRGVTFKNHKSYSETLYTHDQYLYLLQYAHNLNSTKYSRE